MDKIDELLDIKEQMKSLQELCDTQDWRPMQHALLDLFGLITDQIINNHKQNN